jgi:hypothetical protein
MERIVSIFLIITLVFFLHVVESIFVSVKFFLVMSTFHEIFLLVTLLMLSLSVEDCDHLVDALKVYKTTLMIYLLSIVV